jgi:hypothetical protein
VSDRIPSPPEFLDLRLVFLDQRVACPSIERKSGDRTSSILKFANVKLGNSIITRKEGILALAFVWQ